jgi:preprotein translocase subunit SecG
MADFAQDLLQGRARRAKRGLGSRAHAYGGVGARGHGLARTRGGVDILIIRDAPAAPCLAGGACVPCAAMEAILSVLQVVISVVLIFLVLMHSGKDSGLSGAFGVGSGQGPLGGGSMVERNLNRWTVFFATLFVGNTILLLKKPWA